MQQNIPLAIVLQAIGSFCFASSAYLQHYALGQDSDGNRGKSRLGFGQLWESIKRPRWLLGLLAMGLSLGLQVLALRLAPVSVVQPVGLLAFPWSIVIQAWAAKKRPQKNVIRAVGVTVGATLAFTIITAVSTSPETHLDQNRVFLGALVIYLCAMSLGWLGSKGPRQWRSLFWASGGALFYGLEAALVRSLMEFANRYDWLHSPSFWSILIALLIGSAAAGWMVQQGYATGPAEIVVAAMTITSPVVAVVFGMAVLGETGRLTGVGAFFMLLLGLIAIGGVIWLTLLHPSFDDVEDEHPEPSPPENEPPEGGDDEDHPAEYQAS